MIDSETKVGFLRIPSETFETLTAASSAEDMHNYLACPNRYKHFVSNIYYVSKLSHSRSKIYCFFYFFSSSNFSIFFYSNINGQDLTKLSNGGKLKIIL